MANQGKASTPAAEEWEMLEQPRPAPLPFSKPRLEDPFKIRTASEPLLTLKNLQRERARYKQSRLSLLSEGDTTNRDVQSVLKLQRDFGDRKIKTGSMSDRIPQTANSDLPLMASFLIGPQEELTLLTAQRQARQHEISVLNPDRVDEDLPRSCPVPVVGFHSGRTNQAGVSRRNEVRKQPSQISASKSGSDRQPHACHVVQDEMKETKPSRGNSASARSAITVSSPRKLSTAVPKSHAQDSAARQCTYPQHKSSEVIKRIPSRLVSTRK